MTLSEDLEGYGNYCREHGDLLTADRMEEFVERAKKLEVRVWSVRFNILTRNGVEAFTAEGMADRYLAGY